MTPLYNHLTISKISIILYLTLTVSIAHSTFCVLFFFVCFCLVLLLHDNHVQPVCTLTHSSLVHSCLSWYLSLQYTVMHIFIFYILFFISYFLLTSFYVYFSLYSIIFALSMEQTWLTFHCWLYILYIIVYVTNKNLESLESWSVNNNISENCILFIWNLHCLHTAYFTHYINNLH